MMRNPLPISIGSSPKDEQGDARIKSSAGFTLLELLVVIAIICILVAIMLPAYGKMSESRRTISCVSNQRAIVSGIILYAGDNNGFLPPYGDDISTPINPWMSKISSYVVGYSTYIGYEELRCPSAEESTLITYGVNYGPFGYAPISYHVAEMPDVYPGSKKLSRVSANTFLLADQADAGWNAAIYHPLQWILDTDADGDGVLDTSGALGYRYNHISPRHNGRIVMAFPDGAIKQLTIAEWAKAGAGLWGDKDH